MFIPALVLQYNNNTYIDGGVAPGTVKLIPTHNSGGFVYGDYWAVPVASNNIVTGYTWVPCDPGDATKPDPQAVHAVRIQSTQNRDDFYVLGTSTQYVQASSDAECCVSPGFDMPTTISNVQPCQQLCGNSDGNQYGVFGLPFPDGGTFTINGYYNDTALPEVTGASAADLVTALNANGSWNAIGTWAKTADNLTLTVTGGAAPDTPNTLCLLVTF